jgi:hypothetical protein
VQADKITVIPHPDIELGWERTEIDAFLTLPESGINDDTGLIMVVDGFDGRADSAYQREELRPYLADKFNCIVVGVNYFGIFRKALYQIKPEFLFNINRIYGLELSLENFKNVQSEEGFYRIIAESVIQRGITSLDIRCQPTIKTGKDEYQSWGLLPAIDCLQVLGEVMKRYDLNQKRIMAYGNGYGAYIALLMAKFAPHTFSVIVDREAYSRAELKHIACGEVMEADYIYAFNIKFSDLKFTIASGSNNPWTIEDELSPYYFSDSHRRSRSLLEEKHRMESETRYYILHSAEALASLDDKDKCVSLLKNYNKVFYNRIPEIYADTAEDFKRFPHESLNKVPDKEIFEWLAELDENNLAKDSAATDFTLNSKHIFDCGEKKYEFQLDDEYNISVKIQEA